MTMFSNTRVTPARRPLGVLEGFLGTLCYWSMRGPASASRSRCFSNLNVRVNHLETLLGLRFRFSGRWPGCGLHVPPALRAVKLLVRTLRFEY